MTSVEHDKSTSPPAYTTASESRAWAVVDGLLVFVVLVMHGAWPVPEVNEAHYILKAQHFWNPHGIERDVFLSSRDSHVVFFAAFGWVPQILTLEAAAWCGRIAAWLLAAWGWRRLSRAVAPRWGPAALSAAAALAANRYGQMAGEWYVGGIEAKSIAYPLLFAGLADIIKDRWNRGLMLLGGAAAFHVLVGGWALVAVGCVWLLEGSRRPAIKSLLPGLAIAAALSAAGLIPGLLLNRGTPAAIVAEAERIHVSLRIAHHLDPEYVVPQLGPHLAAVYGAWLAFYVFVPADDRLRRLRHFAVGALGILAAGLVIGYGVPADSAWRASLLKYYWFRLADVAGPAALALEAAALTVAARPAAVRAAALAAMAAGGAYHLGETAYTRAHTTMGRGENLFDPNHLAGWRDACGWIRTNTERDALVLAPRSFNTFKWYAGRAEFASWKDVPQDAASLVEWKRRLDRLYFDGEVHWVNYLPAEHLREICREYEVDYVLAYVEPPLELPLVYRNNEFAVYEVPGDGRTENRAR